MSYPKYSKTFTQFIYLNERVFDKYIKKKLDEVKPFDVTLRDGLQSLSNPEKEYFTTNNKIKLYNYLIRNYSLTNLEIGSLVNTKLLPIFKDTEKVFEYAENNNKLINHYVLVPNQEQLLNALKLGVRNFSFITSVSNKFQFKNTRMLLNDNLHNLNEMMNILDNYKYSTTEINDINDIVKPYKVKLYISCINECPLEGKISLSRIISELYCVNMLKFDKFCLSDTCGSLTNEDFIKIMEKLINNVGIDVKKISLHLHINPDREDEVEKLVHTALDYGINEFDVSDLKTGGCSITMEKNRLVPNMNYQQYYKFLTNYLLK